MVEDGGDSSHFGNSLLAMSSSSSSSSSSIRWCRCLLAASFLVLALLVASTSSVAVMSVDLGSEWMKVAVVTVS